MAYTLSTMLTEAYSRGFAFLNDGGAGATRMTRWINESMHSVDDEERWDYRLTSNTGTAPLTITDLGEIQSVKDSNNNTLAPGDQGVLQAQYDDLTMTGTALYYYVVGGVIKTFPVSTLTLTVTYWKVGPDLTAGSDAPLMPDRFRRVIVELAVAEAYRDQDDEEMAQACEAKADRLIQKMREVYVLQPGASRQTVSWASASDW